MIEDSFYALMFMLLIGLNVNLIRPRLRNLLLTHIILVVLNVLMRHIYYVELNSSYVYGIFEIFVTDLFYGPILYLYLLVILKEEVGPRLILYHYAAPLFLATVKFIYKYFSDRTIDDLAFVLYPAISSIIVIVYFILGLIKLRKLSSQNKPIPKKRFNTFFLLVNAYLVLSSLIYFISLGYYIENITVRTITKGIIEFYYNIIQYPFFLIFCVAIFLYSITEAIWLKRYFIIDPTRVKLENEKVTGVSQYDILKKRFLEDKYYLDPNINANKFAKALNIKSDVLNYMIRKNGFKNFTAFANYHRVQVFIQKLIENQHSNLTIDGLASNCGFKSKSTFYRIFKEETNKTPLQYKESLSKKTNI
ncbi:MAG: helix-turn-helix domain-containing protein [Bacteroidota bacterium]